MLSDQCIRHIPASRCSSRAQEVASVKKDDHLLRLENSALRLASKPVPMKVDLSSELRLAQALSRRSAALEMAGVASYENHEDYVRGLMEHLHHQPPPGFVAASIDQVMRADRELWIKVAEEVGSDLTSVNSVALVNAAIAKFSNSAAVAFHLYPVPKPPKEDRKRPWEDLSPNQPWRYFERTPKGRGKGKEKGKHDKVKGGGKWSKSKDKQTSVPSALKGMDPNYKGHPVCFNHNLPHGCSEETWDTDMGTQCRRGLHVCIRCHGKHSLQACDQ